MPSELYAPSGARHLLGMHVESIGFAAWRRMSKSRIDNPEQFEAVAARPAIRCQSTYAAFSRTSRPDPLNVAVVVNGIVAAIAHSYQDRDGHAVRHAHS